MKKKIQKNNRSTKKQPQKAKTEKKHASRKKPKSETCLPEGKVRNQDSHLRSLRKRAEDKLRTKLFDIETVPQSALKEVFHELQAHQIELEMQNEELRMAQFNLEESRSRYADLYDFAPVGYFTFDTNGTILEANLTGAGMAGIERGELLRKPFSHFILREDQDIFYLHRKQVVEKGDAQSCELRLKRKDGSIVWVRLQSIATEDRERKTFQCRTTISDITPQKRAEEALRESEERYRSIFEGANDGIIAYDLRSNKFLFINKRMSALTGYTEEEILRLRVSDLHPPKDLPYVLEQFNKAVSGEIKKSRTIPVFRKDGSVIYCDISSSFMKINDSPLLLGFFRDVTEREAAESALRESERRFRNTFENAAVGIVQADTEGRFLQMNQTFCDFIGYPHDELQGMKFHKVTHPDDLGADVRQTKRLIRGEIDRFSMEKRYIHRDGHIVWGNLTLSVQRNDHGNAEYVIGIVEDISEKKKAEFALHETLQDLERSNSELEQFAYIVSHDLKEPLRMINSYVQILNKRYRDRLDTKADEFIDFIVEGTTRMDDLLDDLLAYSRVGKKGGPFQPVDLNNSVKFALDNLKRVVNKSSAEIQHSDLPTVTADEVQMIQVFQNMIGNAIKFRGSEAPRIDISSRPSGHEWTICVRDNGIGIDPKHLERIFLMFRRLHGRGKYPGTGVGLSICKKIVERHGGRIWAESEPGKGSKFCFTIKKTGNGL